jgi:hypothetical protein
MNIETQSPTPIGQTTLIVLHDTNGETIAIGLDHDVSGIGGYSLKEAQHFRAMEKLRDDFAYRYLHTEIADVVPAYLVKNIIDDVSRAKRYSMKVTYMGHEA